MAGAGILKISHEDTKTRRFLDALLSQRRSAGTREEWHLTAHFFVESKNLKRKPQAILIQNAWGKLKFTNAN